MERRPGVHLLAAAMVAVALAAGLGPIARAAGTTPHARARGGQQANTRPAGGQAAVPGAGQKKDPAERFLEPWPDAETLHGRRLEAEHRALFASSDPLAVSLAADFRTVNKDRDRNSARQYAAQFTVPATGNTTKAVNVTIAGRGNLRRRPELCTFIPLRLAFADADVKDTPFEGLAHVKLVTHCRKEYEQYVLGEYLVYRVFNLFTPRSFRARLARVTYADSATKSTDTRWGLFVEDQDDVARRMEGRAVELPRRLFVQLVPDALLRLMVLQYLVGNTDFSIYALHNIRLVQTPAEARFYPISYDFDVAGLVDSPYGTPDRRFPIKTIRDRYYRGPCVTADQLDGILAEFRPRKAQTLALVDAVPGLDRDYRQRARDYLAEFFDTINDKGSIKRAFIDRCVKGPYM